jgi:hypothetical protein
LITVTTLLLITGLLAQAQAPPPATKDRAAAVPDDPAARLEIMKKAMMAYHLRSADDRESTYRLQPEPVLRFTNPVGVTRDGAIFLWLDANGRPAAAAQVSAARDGRWFQELSSLSTGLLTATSTTGHEWRPSKAGVEFKPVPGAPTPAETAAQRLRQMHDLTREITAEDFSQDKSWQTLRLLSKPFARYGKPDSDPIDGALFAYVLTTDPEVYLMLEARTGKGRDGPEWQYAFAPSTTLQVRGKVKGVEVWGLPRRPSSVSKDPNMPFHYHWFQPGE